MITTQRADLAIDQFVARVNQGTRERLAYDEVPEFLREQMPGVADAMGVPWTIRPAALPCARMESFEAKLPGRLPRSYRSLVTRYLFPAFEVGAVMLFANTGVGVHEELVDAPFRDRFLATPLLASGFVQLGRRDAANYDPICFDLNRRTNSGECSIVHLDHEAALMQQRVEVVAELAPSFLELVGA